MKFRSSKSLLKSLSICQRLIPNCFPNCATRLICVLFCRGTESRCLAQTVKLIPDTKVQLHFSSAGKLPEETFTSLRDDIDGKIIVESARYCVNHVWLLLSQSMRSSFCEWFTWNNVTRLYSSSVRTETSPHKRHSFFRNTGLNISFLRHYLIPHHLLQLLL